MIENVKYVFKLNYTQEVLLLTFGLQWTTIPQDQIPEIKEFRERIHCRLLKIGDGTRNRGWGRATVIQKIQNWNEDI